MFTGGQNGGRPEPGEYEGNKANGTGIFALDKADIFNLLCIPPITRETPVPTSTWAAALAYCKDKRAMLLVDPDLTWKGPDKVVEDSSANKGLFALRDKNAILYYPRVKMADSPRESRLVEFPPCGVAAGVIARTDASRGVWKAPAGLEATLIGVRELTYEMTDPENGRLNPIAVNALRRFPGGIVIWGARTMDGSDDRRSEWKYIPVRRTALFIEESLLRGTQWAVFEPNDERLWAQMRLNVGAFMYNLFRQGAFQGTSPQDSYFVKCDKETIIQGDIDKGIVNIVVGFAPLRPAEFVVIKVSQMAGQATS